MNSTRNIITSLLLLCAWFVAGARAETNAPVAIKELKPGPDDVGIAIVVARMLEQGHYTGHRFDNEMSSKMLDQYINMLDPQHIHFLQTDLDKFEPYRKRLDDLILRRGDTWPAYEIFTTFRERLEQRTEYVDELLKTEKFAFTNDERILLNRKDEPAPKSMAEAKKLWSDRLRAEYLQEKLGRSDDGKTLKKAKPASTNGAPDSVDAGKTLEEEIEEVLSKRYHRNLHFFQEMDHDDVFELYITSLARVYDPHTDYMGKSQLEQFSISMNLALFGIGAQLQLDEDGFCKVLRLMPGGPAIKSKKIKEGDLIVAVAQSNAAPVDVVGMNLNKTVQYIRGQKGTEVRLTLESPDTGERRIVSLVRDEIPLEDQQAKAKIIDLPGEGDVTNRLGIIDLPSFYASMETLSSRGKSEPRFTSEDVAALIKKMKQEQVEGIILDLRRNGGGSLEEAVKLTGLFIKEGPVVQVKGPRGDPIVDADQNPAVLWDGPLVVLTSRFSASASEIVAAALQDYGRALVVGDSSTHGKGTVQSLNQLKPYLRMAGLDTTNEPGALKYTIRKFYRASGASTQFKGVTPDLVLPSVLNHSEDIGEASLDYALPWDTIESAEYDKLNRIAPYLQELKKHSDERIAKSKDFAYIREDIDQYLERREDRSVSLNEAERRKEKAEEDARNKAREEERKARKRPEPVVYDITLKQADLPGLPEPEDATNSHASVISSGAATAHQMAGVAVQADDADDDEDKAPPVDPTLDETEFILVDYLGLMNKVVTAKVDP